MSLGIVAHVDAGKTSLTERLLYAAGVIDEIGSVDAGSTSTDFLALERQRGITIKSAVVSFVIDDVTVNLIDTPGHPDFIAEVQRVLSVLDGAVLVVSAVEGVQSQTRVLMRTLQALHIPTLVFVNKIDRRGAAYGSVLGGIAERLRCSVVPMGSVEAMGTPAAAFTPFSSTAVGDSAAVAALADNDEALLAAFVDDEKAVSYGQIHSPLAAQTKRALVHPVFFGSATTGAGVEPLMAGIAELLPSWEGEPGGPVSGTVFKVERGPTGAKIAYVRMFSGTVRVRDRLSFRGGEGTRVTAISVFHRGSAEGRASIAAGEIGTVWGLGDVQIGDAVGVPRVHSVEHHFAPPTLETVVVPSRPADSGALHVALAQLAEQDPLINVRRDEPRREVSVSLFGEVQKEVIQATLASDYGVNVTFRETTTICIERPTGVGAAVEIMGVAPNPFLATVGLRIEPAPIGAGVTFGLDVELGSMPYAFIKAVEETVSEALEQGLYGWSVTDCTVTMTHSGYAPRQSSAHGRFDKSISSTAGDFRLLTPLVVMSALTRARTRVCEPMHRFQLELSLDALGPVLPVLTALRAVPGTPAIRGSLCLLDGVIPAARVHQLTKQLPGLTGGEGVLESAFERYQPVRGPAPTRTRTDPNPLNRKEYLLEVLRRVPLR